MARRNSNSKQLSDFDTEEVKLERMRNKAKHEIGEVDELIPQRIEELKELLCEQGYNKNQLHPPIYDEFYLKCLRARKYDTERAAKLYGKYCHLRTNHPDVIASLIPSQYEDLYLKKVCSILHTRDSKGRHVFIVRVEKWDTKESSFDDLLSMLLLLLDEVINSIDTQLHGVVVIGDFKSLSLSHVRMIGPTKLQNIASVIQDSYPARFKEIHAFNNPYVFNMIWALGKPFLKDKIRKRVHFHGSDTASLHRALSLDPKQLPTFLGGEVPEDKYADLGLIESLVKKDEYCKDFFRYGNSGDDIE